MKKTLAVEKEKPGLRSGLPQKHSQEEVAKMLNITLGKNAEETYYFQEFYEKIASNGNPQGSSCSLQEHYYAFKAGVKHRKEESNEPPMQYTTIILGAEIVAIGIYIPKTTELSAQSPSELPDTKFGAIAALSLQGGSLSKDKKFGEILAHMLATIYELKDLIESAKSVEDATRYKDLFMKILRGEITPETLNQEVLSLGLNKDTLSPNFLSSCTFYNHLQESFLTGARQRTEAQLTKDLKGWWTSVTLLLDSAITNVESRLENPLG